MHPWVSLLLWLLFASRLLVGPHTATLPLPPPPVGEGEDCSQPRDELSPAQEQAMFKEIQHSIQNLRLKGNLTASNPALALTYIHPVRLAPGSPDYAGYRVSAFVDHNPAAPGLLDYNGGARTYDGHHGTDYALWPFSWNKVDAGEVQVIAAAAGTIAYSANADASDHNCGGASSDPWNYVALVHADGRLTIYGHMRYNSLTSKGIGQSVEQGEYLGTAASSGNSSGPHLHFEVRYGGFSNSEWLDPYAGPKSQAQSLWANQLPYFDSAINTLSTHSAPPSTPNLCQPSIPNLQDSFTTPARVYFYAHYRDYQSALPTDLKLYRPDESVYRAWQYAPGGNTFQSAWYQGWVVDLTSSDPSGTWRFEAVYKGQVYKTYFNLNAPFTTRVTSPNGGEQWDRHQTHPITWTDNMGGNVNIVLFHNGAFSAPIVYNTPSDGEYLWLPDTALDPGSGYTIRISSALNPAAQDAGDAPFTLDNGHLVAREDRAMILINTPVTLDVLGNDTSPNHIPMTITALEQPGSGHVSIVEARILYTPSPDFLGKDVFTYTVSANNETTSTVVTVYVAAEIYRLSLPVIQR